MNKREIYIKNNKKAKTLKILTPIIFWGLIFLAILFLIITVKNSFGNMDEITSMLDSKKFNGEELKANYNFLIDKYGEWVIGNGSIGFTLTFINVKNAVFSGLVIFSGIFSVVCLLFAFIFGKWLLPIIVKKLTQNNQDMVNLTILDSDTNNTKEEKK